MFSAEHSATPPAVGRSLSLSRLAVVAPVLIVALVLGLLVQSRMAVYHGNPAGFILFGQRFAQYTHPREGAPIESRDGYDGQFYWIQANDPLLLRRSTIVDMRGPAGYHFQRPAYPALAFLLSLGQRAALPWALLAVNVLAVLGLTAGFAAWCRGRGRSCWWALAIGVMPGLLMPTLRDLTDPLATATMLGGLLAWYSERRWLSAALLSVSVLTREPMAAAVGAIALESAVRCVQARFRLPAVRRIAARAWPPVVLPAAGYALWQAYIRLAVPPVRGAVHVGSAAAPAGSAAGFLQRLGLLLHSAIGHAATWETLYVAAMVAAMCAAAWLARRGRAAGTAALAFAAILTIVPLDDGWVLTRYSAPLFGALLLGGIEQRSRVARGLCVAASALTILLPWVMAGV